MTVAPTSPSPRANAKASPPASPSRASGSTTRKNVFAGPAPSVREAATPSGSTAPTAHTGRPHAREDLLPRAGAERARSCDPIRIDGLEGHHRRKDVERARHEGDREHDGRLRERDTRAQQADTAERREQAPSRG